MDHKTLKLQSLEHHVHRQLKPCLKGRGFLLLAVSGGMDSMVLLSILHRLAPLGVPPLHLAHIHHGLLPYRDQAQDFVRAEAEKLKVVFHTNSKPPEQELESEAELREFRYQQLSLIMGPLEKKYSQPGLLLTAHHWDDQVETRLLRLIRGTGPRGFKAMSPSREGLLRPLLEVSSDELKSYAEKLKLNWVDDPSNSTTNAMRNWLRNEWLPALEKKQKGAVKSLALSMERISDSIEEEPVPPKIARPEFNTLMPNEKSKLLVRYLDHAGCRDHSGAQVNELVKRLDTSRREHRFHLLKFEWRLNAEHIWIHQD